MNMDRRNQIVDMINQQRTVKNSDIMARFNVSIETVRRDLEYLEQKGYLRRVYGGAVLNVSLNSEPEYSSRAKALFREKAAIAAEAAKLIQPGDCVYLGVGTTVQAMAAHVKNMGEITVFTNALHTAVELSESPNCTVILSGGRLRSKELTISGYPAEENFACFNIDKAFIGIGGISKSGITDFHIEEARLHRQLIKNARQSIVLTDSGKFELEAIVNVCPLEDIDIVITDSNAPPHVIRYLEQAGVHVICAKV